MTRGHQLLLIALSLAGASLVIILITHFYFPKPLWLYAPSVLPEPIYPEPAASEAPDISTGPSEGDSAKYQGLLLGALGVGGLGFNCWLWGMRQLRNAAAPSLVAGWLKVLPALLLMPCAIHVIGAQRHNRETIRVNQEWMQKYLALKKAYQQKHLQANDAQVRPSSNMTGKVKR